MDKLDLFGEVVVTLDDVELWLDAVPQIPRDSPRRNYYAKHWDVANKIKCAKRDGSFTKLINRHLDNLASLHSGQSGVADLYAPRFR